MNYCPFKQFRNIFGIARKGIHSIRFMDVALVDYFITIIFAFFLTFISNIPVEITTIFSFILGIVSHILFGVPTNTSKFLGFTCL